MEVQDGFIVGVFNYCDRWCERCAFASRCRLFADVTRYDANDDGNFKELLAAKPHPQDVREPPAWLANLIEEANAAAQDAIENARPAVIADDVDEKLPAPYLVICERARSYGFRVHEWLRNGCGRDSGAERDPIEVIEHFAIFIPPKIFRALTGLAEFDGDRDFPPDHEGSAKIALIAIERSMAAWRDLGAQGAVADDFVAEMVGELGWLRSEIEAAIPRAVAFVRPGFDEPEEVKRLEETDLS